ncbi:putative siderophore transport system permease protein YfhA [Marinomonas aquimarina]|uniref:Putative siderophore transport system permease protein YfhA n=1 Tax=Marinomonas aquimarina TaxID=295068 RepID=A0A1A8T8L4_9GAMM|nr:iron ABC transporter permease [Marinomonas aquimarina]SBS28236.1 putative siderophore transport system permease protein YfhA [Marinomonas aquimarina]
MSVSDASDIPLTPPSGHYLLSFRHTRLLLDKVALKRNLLLSIALLFISIASLGIGTLTVPPKEVLLALMGQGDSMTQFVINELRLNRLLAGIYSGAAFSIAGCLMQTVARNRLATPGIIGIDNAAMAFAVASVVGVGISLAPSAMALTGAASATALAFLIGGGSGTRGYRFIVAGLAIGSVSAAVSQLLLSQVHIDTANEAYPWTVGSLSGHSEEEIPVMGMVTLIGVLLSLLLCYRFQLMAFSDSVITALGRTPNRLRLAAVAISVALTGFAVALAGPVGLVALVGPEMARTFARHKGLPLLSSALCGAIVMVLADLAGRTLLSPIEIPVGVITAVVGGPYLLWILIRKPKRSSL